MTTVSPTGTRRSGDHPSAGQPAARRMLTIGDGGEDGIADEWSANPSRRIVNPVGLQTAQPASTVTATGSGSAVTAFPPSIAAPGWLYWALATLVTAVAAWAWIQAVRTPRVDEAPNLHQRPRRSYTRIIAEPAGPRRPGAAGSARRRRPDPDRVQVSVERPEVLGSTDVPAGLQDSWDRRRACRRRARTRRRTAPASRRAATRSPHCSAGSPPARHRGPPRPRSAGWRWPSPCDPCRPRSAPARCPAPSATRAQQRGDRILRRLQHRHGGVVRPATRSAGCAVMPSSAPRAPASHPPRGGTARP